MNNKSVGQDDDEISWTLAGHRLMGTHQSILELGTADGNCQC